MEDFKLHGKTIRIARLLKGISIKGLGRLTGIDANFIAMMEREEASISYRNYWRFLLALREMGYTDQQLIAITILVENIKEKEEEE